MKAKKDSKITSNSQEIKKLNKELDRLIQTSPYKNEIDYFRGLTNSEAKVVKRILEIGDLIVQELIQRNNKK